MVFSDSENSEYNKLTAEFDAENLGLNFDTLKSVMNMIIIYLN